MKKFVVILKNHIESIEESFEFSSFEGACQKARELEKELSQYWERGVDFDIEVKF